MKRCMALKVFLILTIAIGMLSITVYPVAAHDGGTSGDLWSHWAWPDLPGLLLIGGVYMLGLQALWKRAGTGSGITRRHAAAFCAGLVVLFIAIISPLDALSEELFSAHMIQHLLLMLVAAPLFVIGRFSLAVAWVIPVRWTSRFWKEWRWKQIWGFLTRPMTAFLLHNFAMWIWHMPRFYEASLRVEWIHYLEHASFFLTAWLFWQVFADLSENAHRGSSARFGVGIFMIFGVMLVSGFLGVLITFSPFVWYPIHIHETALYGLTALEDQQLAGTLMWVPANVVYLASVLGVMGRWLFAMDAVETPQS